MTSPVPAQDQPTRIVGLGGALRRGSSTEKALECALEMARELGAETQILTGSDIALPPFTPDADTRTSEATRLVDELRNADGVILASPAYHGGISGLIKNALDYIEDLRLDERTYLSGRGVGCVVTAGGPQASVTTLSSLRSIIHSLRGWPTPLGVTICASSPIFDEKNQCTDDVIHASLETMVNEVVWFARRMNG